MIRRFQALRYRCLRHVDIDLDRFQVLVGANASGKSTVFDALLFFRDLVWGGLEEAVDSRAENFRDLVWDRPKNGGDFELAVEFDVPKEIRAKLPKRHAYRRFRYEVAISDHGDSSLQIDRERGLLIPERQFVPRAPHLFPSPSTPVESILLGGHRPGHRSVLSKSPLGRDSFYIEKSEYAGKGWATNIALGPSRSALGNLPESEENFPMATWVKRAFVRMERVFPNGRLIGRPSHPTKWRYILSPDASNLAWVVRRFRKKNRADYEEWLAHVQTVLKDLKSIRAVESRNDRHAHLVLETASGISIPSWTVSDGTLRLLALTLLAYLPSDKKVYCVEEPENGIHPVAIDAIYDSLWSVHDSQVMVATHSPAFLRKAYPEEILCFAKDSEGATDIVRGDRHPMLREWKKNVDTTALFATGVMS